MNLIFDTHAHYHDSAFDIDRKKLLDRLPSFGVSGVINCSTNLENAEETIKLCKKYEYIFAGIGIHPLYVKDLQENYQEKVIHLAKENRKVVCIGEIGLDYYHNKENKEEQKEFFENQIKIAKKLDLPVVVHDRESHEDVLKILEKHKPKGVVHCFSGDSQMANKLVEIGMYLGFGGTVTFRNTEQIKDVLLNIPEERILLETDAPYLAPKPFRKKRCDSSFILYTAKKIAEIKNTSIHDLLWATKENACDLFSLSF
ncbi:MAG: TatD family hydrolase [Oscillospiraceae bacterium]|jgi:TatD DNase family protein|nr:TatD family hydrolase [Oscillospiraceae bacterium]